MSVGPVIFGSFLNNVVNFVSVSPYLPSPLLSDQKRGWFVIIICSIFINFVHSLLDLMLYLTRLLVILFNAYDSLLQLTSIETQIDTYQHFL